MVIDLTTTEKNTFFRFLSLYLGSAFILMVLVAFLYFQNEKTLYFDLTKSKMQNVVAKLSNEIIFAHMRGTHFDQDEYLENIDYKLSFYDENQNKLFGNIDEKIDFDKKFIQNNDFVMIIDNSTVGHLGIDYIVIKDNSFTKKIDTVMNKIIVIFIISFLFISFVGFYLAKLFLKPIKDEREKLNNFIKDTTHELNTPISAILMSTEDENLNSKQIERIKLSAKRVSEIYKDLTYVFLRKDVKNYEIEELDLSFLIKEQLNYFEPLANKKKIEIILNIEKFFYKIEEDEFIRLFNNIVSNAIKYNKVNGKIEISLKNRVLIVKDTGIGIEKSKLKDIFNRYYRATSEQGGFGIGLNIVYEISKKYNIKVEVDSTFNESTTIILRF